MRSYQSVLILKPDLDETQVEQATENITDFIKGFGGACLKIEDWGKKRLAYKVRKNRFGIYLNIYHTCENDKVSQLEGKYKLFDAIIKFMVLVLEDRELERVLGEESKETEEQAGNDAKPKAPAQPETKAAEPETKKEE